MRIKPLYFGFFFLVFVTACRTESKIDPALTISLQKRLTEYADAIRQININRVLTYYYPGIFSFLSADRHKALLEGQLNQPGVRYRVESVVTDSIYPVFEADRAFYSKARIKMAMLFPQDSAEQSNAPETKTPPELPLHGISAERYPAPRSTLMAALIRNQSPDSKISFDSVKNCIRIQTDLELIAVKDSISPEWSFIGLRTGDTLLNRLLNQKVIDKLAGYK